MYERHRLPPCRCARCLRGGRRVRLPELALSRSPLEEAVEEARERTPRHSLSEVDARGIRGWWYLALAVLERRETWVPRFNLYLETATDWADGPGSPSFVEANRANEAQRLVLARDPYRWPGET